MDGSEMTKGTLAGSDVSDDKLSLNSIGLEEGTDKSILAGDYLHYYDDLLVGMRDDEFNLIEIGVLSGSSLRMWERFFTRATLIGIDVNPDCRVHVRERIKVYIGSQDDPEVLHRVVSAHPPRIIIDDGSHRSDHIIFAFEHIFPALLPGGYYVIEDLHFHFLPADRERLRGASPVLANDYFLDLAKLRLGGSHVLRQMEGPKRYMVQSIDSVTFISQAAIIRKKAQVGDVVAVLAEIKARVAKSGDWLSWFRLAHIMMEQGLPDADVVDALRASVALSDKVGVVYERLSEALARTGDSDGAIAALQRALALSEGNPEAVAALHSRLDRLLGVRDSIRKS
jgi:hypothetical protein